MASVEEDDVLDVLHNGGLVKTVKTRGTGERPELGSTVTVHYQLRLASTTTVVEDTRNSAPVTFECGQGDVMAGLDLVAALMNVGEVAEVKVASKYGYDSYGRPPSLPADADLLMDVELLAAEPPKMVEEMTLEERVGKAAAKRRRGNDLYGRKDVAGALSAYSRGLKILDTPAAEDDATADIFKAAADKERAQLLSNQGQCLRKLGDLSAASASCELCLVLEPNNIKVLCRSAAILCELNELEAAAERLKKLLVLDPSNAEARQLRKQLEERRSKQQSEQREVYGRMFTPKAELYKDRPTATDAAAAASGGNDDNDKEPDRDHNGTLTGRAGSIAHAVWEWLLANPSSLISIVTAAIAALAVYVVIPLMSQRPPTPAPS